MSYRNMTYGEEDKHLVILPPDIEAGYEHIKCWLRIYPYCSEDEKIRQFWLKMFGDSKYSSYKESFYYWYEGKEGGKGWLY